MTIHATKPMRLNVKKLKDRNTISIRDYQVENAIGRGKDIIIHYKTHTMFIPFEEIMERATYSGKMMNSIYNTGLYELVDFEWRPDS